MRDEGSTEADSSEELAQTTSIPTGRKGIYIIYILLSPPPLFTFLPSLLPPDYAPAYLAARQGAEGKIVRRMW